MTRLKRLVCGLFGLGVLGYLASGQWPEVNPSQVLAAQPSRIDFNREILPIFKDSCFQCHSASSPQGELRLDSKAAALKGGVSGPAIIAGNGRGSLLVRRLLGAGGEMRMPPGKPLTAAQIRSITAWIDQGAHWPEETPANQASAAAVDFMKEIQPIFKASCYACHSGERPRGGLRLDARALALKGGVSGQVIVPGNSKDSRLVHRIEGHGDEPRMPLNREPLAPEQIALIRRWIDGGAVWPDEAAGGDARIARHWAFIAPERQSPPKVKNGAWVRTPLDNFILAELEKRGLEPSPAASKETLIRRLSLDLTGLPPTIAEIDRFLADQSPDAYEKLVERLLDSPHYGERWGRWWLDAARYADTNGFEKDLPRSIWPYRDWVINAFNRDLPFDRFTIEQLAGDLLPASSLEQRIATGFLRNSMLNQEGGVDPEQFRVEGLIDRVDAIGKAFLGLTINCAQCHTHKYDPIPHQEYYQFYAFLNSDDEPEIEVPGEEVTRKRAEILQQVAKIEDELIAQDRDLPQRLASWEAQARTHEGQWVVLDETEIFAAFGTKFDRLEDHSYLAKGDNSTGNNYIVKARTRLRDLTGFRLELLTDPNLPRTGPGRANDGGLFLSEFAVEAAPIAKPEASEKVALTNPTADFSPRDRGVGLAIDGDLKTAWSIDAGPGRRNQDRQAVFAARSPVGFEGGTLLTFQLTQKQDDRIDLKGGKPNIGRFRLSVTVAADPHADPLPAGVRRTLAIPAAKRTKEQQREIFSYYRTTDPRYTEANRSIDELMKEWPYGPTTLALSMRRHSRETRLFKRGDWRQPDRVVAPGVPSALHPFPAGAPSNRLGLAQWIVDRRNPLTSRVIVNRIWQQYFGQGLVATPEDFGTRCEPPSHPALLDFLACELRDQGWSIKAIHRSIVNSATYRQSSRATPKQLESDPLNRWLGRMPRLRVEAEIVRDLALASSGLLSRKIGGPSVFPPIPDGVLNLSYGEPMKWETPTGEDRYRRALYTFWKRSVPYPSLSVFDAPNADFSCTRRIRSNTPLQALTTLNDKVFMEAAQALALRVWKEGGADDQARMIYAFRLCTGRKPEAFELRELTQLLGEQQKYFEGKTAAAVYVASPDLTHIPEDVDLHRIAPWTIVARVLLNLDETITRE